MPKLRTSRKVRARKIPSNCEYPFTDIFQPVFETQKVQKEAIEHLCCRLTHCVKLKHVEHDDGDILYNIFAINAGQNCEFIRRWLHHFMVEVYPKNFAGIGSSYFQSKGLNFQEWAAGILTDIKADFFALYGLCLLTERHAVIHLKDGKIWTSLKNPLNDHDKILEMCQLHLVYLGRNLFVELTKRLNPIQIIESNEDVKVISLGGLTFDESETLDKVIYRGLGVGVHRIPGVPVHAKYGLQVTNPPSEVIIKQEHNEESETNIISAEERTGDPEPHSSRDQNLEEESYKTKEKDSLTERVRQQESETEKETSIVKKPDSMKLKVAKILIKKLDLKGKSTVKLTGKMLEDLECYSSDDTIEYWTGEHIELNLEIIEERLKKIQKIILPKKRLISGKPSKAGFRLTTHGVKKQKSRTYIKCIVPMCKDRFPSVKIWNTHHRQYHKGWKLECKRCQKPFRTPSAMRDHMYIHADTLFKCSVCDSKFAFKSSLLSHKKVHSKARMHRCFSGGCTKKYKWAQDLHHHIKKHLNIVYHCCVCDYSSHEKRRVKGHFIKHQDIKKYVCEKCNFSCKYHTQWIHHLVKCPI